MSAGALKARMLSNLVKTFPKAFSGVADAGAAT
jgi:hypothetical protein